jgi:hypothetical protein
MDQFFNQFQDPGALQKNPESILNQQQQINQMFKPAQQNLGDSPQQVENIPAGRQNVVNAPPGLKNNYIQQDAVVQHNVGSRNLLYLHSDLSNYTSDQFNSKQLVVMDNRENSEQQTLIFKQGNIPHFAARRKLLVEKSLEGMSFYNAIRALI